MVHNKWYACALACRQVSAHAVCFLMKLDGIVRGMMDGIMCVKSPHNIIMLTSSMSPETRVTTL